MSSDEHDCWQVVKALEAENAALSAAARYWNDRANELQEETVQRRNQSKENEMTDKELLELAAKAAGVKGRYVWSGLAGGGCIETGDCMANQGHWNPLVDDGDALRLAVAMHMSIDFFWNFQTIAHVTGGVSVSELHQKDPDAATRRAIVRAAAEIGKEMK